MCAVGDRGLSGEHRNPTVGLSRVHEVRSWVGAAFQIQGSKCSSSMMRSMTRILPEVPSASGVTGKYYLLNPKP